MDAPDTDNRTPEEIVASIEQLRLRNKVGADSSPRADATAMKYRWCIVELDPAPVDTAFGCGWTDLQRVVVVRDTFEDAQRVLNVLYETSIGDEVLAIQGRRFDKEVGV
jgi:hypothetical protein